MLNLVEEDTQVNPVPSLIQQPTWNSCTNRHISIPRFFKRTLTRIQCAAVIDQDVVLVINGILQRQRPVQLRDRPLDLQPEIVIVAYRVLNQGAMPVPDIESGRCKPRVLEFLPPIDPFAGLVVCLIPDKIFPDDTPHVITEPLQTPFVDEHA